jgi:predicted alpha/beta-fold hydrolase
MVTSKDDPVIPYANFIELNNSENLEVKIQKHGRHCGFIHFFQEETWYSEEIQRQIQESI